LSANLFYSKENFKNAMKRKKIDANTASSSNAWSQDQNIWKL